MINGEGRELHPLLAAQRGVWVAQMLDTQSPLYNVGEYLDIQGVVDPVRFEHALRRAVADSDSLLLQFVATADPAALDRVRQAVDSRLATLTL